MSAALQELRKMMRELAEEQACLHVSMSSILSVWPHGNHSKCMLQELICCSNFYVPGTKMLQ